MNFRHLSFLGGATACAMRFCEILCEYLRSKDETYASESLYMACARGIFSRGLKFARTLIILRNNENYAVVMAGWCVGFTVFTKSHTI